MTWLTWRQFRGQAIAAAVIITAILGGLAATGPRLASMYGTSGIPDCVASGACAAARRAFLNDVAADPAYPGLFFGGLAVLYLAPPLIGVFWGAPLVTRELEAGTLRLVWNQSITRGRWLAVKLAVIGAATMAVAGLLSLALTWWAAPIDLADTLAGQGQSLPIPFDPIVFGARDISPIGYAAVALAIGVTTGVLLRRTLPAMAVALVAIAAVQIGMATVVRPVLFPAEHVTVDQYSTSNVQLRIRGNRVTVYSPVNIPGAWILGNQTVTTDGAPFSVIAPPACMTQSIDDCLSAIGDMHPRQRIDYQPAERFWTFQWLETGILVGLALVLAGVSMWLIQRVSIP